MKKFFYTLFVAVFVAAIFSCTKEDILLVKQLDDAPQTRFDPIYIGGNWQDNLINNDSTMVFGPQLANPYNVDVMRQALATIREDNPDFFFPAINTSHYYVRFQPDSYEQMCDLFARDTSIIYFDFPLDREIVSGNSYHDPAIVDTLPTYQYASIRKTKWNNLINGFDIDYEILDELFIPDDAGLTIIGYTPRPGVGDITPINPGDSTIWGHPIFPGSVADPNSSGTSVTWNAVNDLEDMAYQITGNSDEEETDTNGSIASPASTTAETMSSSSNGRWTPSGRIRVYDDVKDGMIPLEGVKVIVYRGCNTKKCYTDSNGNFTCGSFKKKANYKIKWESNRWDIHDGLAGQAYYNGPKSNGEWILDIGQSNNKSLRYATIHRAAHRVYFGEHDSLYCPLKPKMKLRYYHRTSANGETGRYRQGANIKIFGKAINKNGDSEFRTTDNVFCTTCHELGHAAHYDYNIMQFTQANELYVESWACCVAYHLTQLEYEYWGVFDNLFDIYVTDEKTYYLPPNYSLQSWSIKNSHYTPIFIDILDDHNQKEVYTIAYNNENLDTGEIPDDFPNDEVCLDNINIAYLQNVVFNNHTLNAVKNILLSTEDPNDANSQYYQINELFNFYESYEE